MKTTIQTIQCKKNQEKITAITAYDSLFASLFDTQVDIILIGDSLNMSFGGKKDTLSITLEEMIYHTKAVCRGAKKSFIITDMPFGTYATPKTAVKNALKIYQKTNADAIKIEGGQQRCKTISSIVQEGIAVVAHIGLMPQFVRSEGGYKIKGKNDTEAKILLEDAMILQEAGACMIVLEGIRSDVAACISKNLHIPTIGIGSGLQCDGQILVWSDLFGFFQQFKPKFVRQYLNGAELIQEALQKYIFDIKSSQFPSMEESY
ncbi:3-methyl-2-oxobutanoate hydroxymethyltransferase [Helicobacter sp. 13S00477-4]|uniref:3-methyl-2-oxobutanoate hydroxymethyltransferase n=1 Tax=Helicobacter sp. 13S00477-4 TaxID=1905759 RepID=UPI000BA6099E|nr:3-methyl-2-oxobutanoate hydroxymethyltransferase [Helicobacter sp. 13S00477-4]